MVVGSPQQGILPAKFPRPDRLLEGERPRTVFPQDARQWHLEGLHIDDVARTVTYREKSVVLSRRELQLLVLLVTRSPGFITPTQLLVQAWHDSRLPEETLRTYIGKVRTKLHSLGVDAEVVNRPRRGYALVFKHRPEEEPSPD